MLVGTGRFERLRRHERRPLAGFSRALALLAPHIGVLVSAVTEHVPQKYFPRREWSGRADLSDSVATSADPSQSFPVRSLSLAAHIGVLVSAVYEATLGT